MANFVIQFNGSTGAHCMAIDRTGDRRYVHQQAKRTNRLVCRRPPSGSARSKTHWEYSRLPHNPYPSVDCSGYGVLGSMDSKKRPNKDQTNKILFKNPENRSEDRYSMLLLLRLPECVRMRLESLSRRFNIIFFSLLPLINDGIQSSHKFSW